MVIRRVTVFSKTFAAAGRLLPEKSDELPDGAREHVHLYPDVELSHSSSPVIADRLDAKGTGAFYNRYIQYEY